MPFHRLEIPTYFGGLSEGYDYINTPADNGDPGDPAPADDKKGVASAPGDQNEGTYFVAFSEPALAVNINRPAKALAENTDFLDDVVHRDLAIPTFLDVSAGHGGTSSLVITGDVYVGDTGAVDDYGTRDQLIQIVDPATGLPLAWQSASGPPVVWKYATVSQLHDGSNNSQVGNEFYTDPTIDLAYEIPDSVAFRVLYYVRGNLTSQPTYTPSRVQQAPTGQGYTLSLISSLLLNAALKDSANSFAASITQTFLGPLSLHDAVSLDKTGTSPMFVDTNSSFKRVLIDAYRVNESPDVYVRIYKTRDGAGSKRGLEITFNARYATDSTPEWASDTTNTSFNPTRLCFRGALASLGNDGLHYEVLDNSAIASTWNESVWASSNARNLQWTSGSMRSGDLRQAIPAFESLIGPSTLASDSSAENPYKLVARFYCGNSLYARIYAGNDDDAGGTGGLGRLIITQNAVWNPATKLWSQDVNTYAALALCFRTGTNTSVSGLSGHSSTSGLTHRGSAFVLLVKNPGAGTWTGQNWLRASGNSGHLRIAGEYCYADTAGGKELLYTIHPLDFTPKPGTSWALTDSITFGGGTEGFTWQSSVNGEDIYIPLRLPYGSKILSFSAEVDPIVAGAGNRLFIQLYSQEIVNLTVTSLGSVTTDGTTTSQTITKDVSGDGIDVEDGNYYFLRIRHALATGNEIIKRVWVNYLAFVNAPGPGYPATTTFSQ